MAVGAIMIGIDILKPNTFVVKSILLTSLRICGLNLFSVNTYIAIKGLQFSRTQKVKGQMKIK
jgi:hypothetical protein